MTDESPAMAPILMKYSQPGERRAERADGHGDGRGHVELRVIDDAGQHERDGDVKHGANAQRTEQGDGHVALRIFRLLRGGGHGVKSDVGEENHARRAHHAAPAELPGPIAGGTNGCQLAGLM